MSELPHSGGMHTGMQWSRRQGRACIDSPSHGGAHTITALPATHCSATLLPHA